MVVFETLVRIGATAAFHACRSGRRRDERTHFQREVRERLVRIQCGCIVRRSRTHPLLSRVHIHAPVRRAGARQVRRGHIFGDVRHDGARGCDGGMSCVPRRTAATRAFLPDGRPNIVAFGMISIAPLCVRCHLESEIMFPQFSTTWRVSDSNHFDAR